jgi:flagellar motor switch protein FliG
LAKRSRTSAEKAAIIIIALGAQHASEIYKNLRNDEVEQLSMEVAKMDKLPPDDLLDIVSDFYNLCVTQKIITEGGVVYAREVLEKAFGSQQAVSLMERVSKSLRIKAFNYIRKADYKTLLMILQNEHPQTIALVYILCQGGAGLADSHRAARDLQFDVIARIAKLDRAVPEIINVVESTLEEKISSIASVDLMEIGGVKYVAIL